MVSVYHPTGGTIRLSIRPTPPHPAWSPLFDQREALVQVRQIRRRRIALAAKELLQLLMSRGGAVGPETTRSPGHKGPGCYPLSGGSSNLGHKGPKAKENNKIRKKLRPRRLVTLPRLLHL